VKSSPKPDFTGEWILDRQESQLAGGASAMESGVLRIDHRDPKCGFEIRMNAGAESVERKWESCVSDEVQVFENGLYGRLFWEKDALVHEFGSTDPDQTWNMVWRYRLFDSGRRLRAVEQMRGPAGDFDNIWIFQKRGSAR